MNQDDELIRSILADEQSTLYELISKAISIGRQQTLREVLEIIEKQCTTMIYPIDSIKLKINSLLTKPTT
jgi:hypothetical protein